MNENAENILLQAQENLSEASDDDTADLTDTGSDYNNDQVAGEITTDPQTSAGPGAAADPQTTADPEAAADPQTAADPEAAADPQTAADPEAATDPESEVLTGEVVSGTLEDPVAEETQLNDITFNVAFLFVLSMIFGLLFFNNLSRKWHA